MNRRASPCRSTRAPTRVVDLSLGFHYDVLVARPSKWGNPYGVERVGRRTLARYLVLTLGEALRGYQAHLMAHPPLVRAARKELRGKTLGCWCTVDLVGRGEIVCHAQILARVADGARLPLPVLAVRET